MRREVRRRTMTSGSTSMSSAASSGRSNLESSASRATAWADVRGKPSRMKPFSVSASCKRSVTKPMITSSGTRSPASMYDFAFCPSGVPAFTAARSMSPVEMCGSLNSSTSLAACVPLPAPGAPNNTMFMMRFPFDIRSMRRIVPNRHVPRSYFNRKTEDARRASPPPHRGPWPHVDKDFCTNLPAITSLSPGTGVFAPENARFGRHAGARPASCPRPAP